jgi:tetratricopeptide (TPR) repeat protein
MKLPVLLLSVVLAGPALAQGRPDPRRVELDQLLTALRSAPSESAASVLESRIRQIWAQSGSPAAALLLRKGLRNLGHGSEADALDDFDAALALEPDYAEAFVQRGLARSLLGDYAGAVRDIEAALEREPRHFVALETLSRIAEQRGDWNGALAAWKKALEIDPNASGGRERLKLLLRKAEGEST